MKREVLGVFRVSNGTRKKHLVYVSQAIRMNRQRVITGARKTFHLDSVDGEEVSSTDDPDIFLLEDGSVLKKEGNITVPD